ncbi:MAG: energy-coupling factor transporter transmembrane component T family protein [Pleomorphochaeta sp.]
MAQALIFHYRDAETFLHKINPFIKLLTLLLLCTSLVTATLINTLIILFVTFLIMGITKLPIIKYGKELTFFVIISLIILITSFLSGENYIEIINSVLKFDTAVLMSFLLADSTDPSDIARSLAKVIDKIPFVNGWRFASQVELTLMCIPLIFDVSQAISEARISRLEIINKHPIRYLKSYTISLIDNLLNKIDIIAYALDSRGYNSDIERETLKYSFKDFIFLFCVLLLIGINYYVR